MSLSCSNTQSPGIMKSIAAVSAKKDNISDLNCSLVSGKKNLSNASVAELATARQAEIKSVDFQSGIKNLNKADKVLQMAEAFLTHARCGLQEMKEIATNATGVMSDSTREASIVPQFNDALASYESGAKTYKYDCMPLLNGDFKHQFIVSSVCGQPTMETINLEELDFTAIGLGLAAEPTAVADIKTDLDDVIKHLQDINPAIGNESALTTAVSKLTSAVNQLKAAVDDLYDNTDNASPELRLRLGGTISDTHMTQIDALKSAVDAFEADYLSKSPIWEMLAPTPGSTEGTTIKAEVDGLITDVEDIISGPYATVETAFVYDTTTPEVKVNTYENAVAAEAVIDAALTKATNAITKVQGQQNALNRIACLSERNVQLQNKVADEYGSVDPIETNAAISKNKMELERAVCALKEYQHMEQAFSRYLSQCADYCA